MAYINNSKIVDPLKLSLKWMDSRTLMLVVMLSQCDSIENALDQGNLRQHNEYSSKRWIGSGHACCTLSVLFAVKYIIFILYIILCILYRLCIIRYHITYIYIYM